MGSGYVRPLELIGTPAEAILERLEGDVRKPRDPMRRNQIKSAWAATEFEIRVQAYLRLRRALRGRFLVRGGFKWSYACPKTGKARRCYFDLALFVPGKRKLVLVVVVRRRRVKSDKQKILYETASGVPCIVASGRLSGDYLVEAVLAHFSSRPGEKEEGGGRGL